MEELYYPIFLSFLQPSNKPRSEYERSLRRLTGPRRGPSIPHPSMWALRMTPDQVMPPTPRPKPTSLPEPEEDERFELYPDWCAGTPSNSLMTPAPAATLLDVPPPRPSCIIATIDPLVAAPEDPSSMPTLTWNLLDNPLSALLKPENDMIALGELRRTAVHSEVTGAPLHAFVLVFPLLPMEIHITHLPTSPSHSAPEPVTVWDVLEGLYRGLRVGITDEELEPLSESEMGTLLSTSETRYIRVPGDAYALHGLRRVDFLAKRLRFMGIRPALGHEVPQGRCLGEVFVVEIATPSDQ
ncbi:hypothetical protein C8Q74DRAFT_1298295 [Fomes fomentarius]|nr:hypothetical protein C8Q74DRAFT_1298295 [Fomes fomentarius]